ncbi:hypothetical protein KKA14_06090 [bacterium]|nr:hypothetical protein [bacterium]
MTADEWLARAIVRMIISDNILHRMEWSSLKSSVKRLGLEINMDQIYDILNSKEARSPAEFRLEPFTSIPVEQKLKMLISLAKIAAIDKEVVMQEEKFFRKATSMLGINLAFADKLLKWACAWADLNKGEEELFELAKAYNLK